MVTAGALGYLAGMSDARPLLSRMAARWTMNRCARASVAAVFVAFSFRAHAAR